MPRKGGPASKFAFDPAALVRYLDHRTELRRDGNPIRERKLLNGFQVDANDNRTIRRWRTGSIQGVTFAAADAILVRHGLNVHDFVTWAESAGLNPIKRGRL